MARTNERQIREGTVERLTAAHKTAKHTERAAQSIGSVDAIGRHRRDGIRFCNPAAESRKFNWHSRPTRAKTARVPVIAVGVAHIEIRYHPASGIWVSGCGCVNEFPEYL